jgi:hypothetical protein
VVPAAPNSLEGDKASALPSLAGNVEKSGVHAQYVARMSAPTAEVVPAAPNSLEGDKASALPSLAGNVEKSWVHAQYVARMSALDNNLGLYHMLGDGNCGWYALYLSLKWRRPSLRAGAPSFLTWQDVKKSVLTHAQNHMDEEGVDGVRWSLVFEQDEVEAISSGKWTGFWLSGGAMHVAARLWGVHIKVLKVEPHNNQTTVVTEDFTDPAAVGTPLVCWLAHTSGPDHFDVFLPRGWVATIFPKKPMPAYFKGHCRCNP